MIAAIDLYGPAHIGILVVLIVITLLVIRNCRLGEHLPQSRASLGLLTFCCFAAYQELRQQAVAVAVHVVVVRVDARLPGERRVRGVGVVVARPFLLASRNLKRVANAIPVKVEVAVAVAVVQTARVPIDGVLTQIVVRNRRVGHEVARHRVEALTLANPVEYNVKIIRRHCGSCPGILNGDGPCSRAIQPKGIGVQRVGVKAIHRRAPVGWP